MKKIISLASPLLIILTLLISLVSFSSLAEAQNIGSLRTVVSTDFSFKKDLQVGDTDPDVMDLQKLLNADVDTVIAVTGPGSAGKESTYFGPLTKASVVKFQTKYRDVILTPAGLTAGTGYVGRLTRTKLNLLIGVMNTYASVGLPQSRAGAGTAAYVQTTVTATPNTGSSMTTCQFVELLINIGAIIPNKANQARSALGCATVSTSGGSSGSTGGSTSGSTGGNISVINRLVPSVDIKINGLNGPISIVSAIDVTLSWTSSNVTSCRSLTAVKPLSGSEAVHVTNSGIFAITCTGPYGTVTDSAAVNLTSVTGNLSVSCLADPNNLTVNNSVAWNTTVTGGTGSYTYSWSGDVTGSTKNVSKQYTTTGIKNGIVRVTSGSLTASASCLALVNAISAVVATSSLPVNTVNNVVATSSLPVNAVGAVTATSTLPDSAINNVVATSSLPVNSVVTPSSLQVSCASDPYAVSLGDSITWTATASGGTGSYIYSWSGTDSLLSNRSSFSKFYYSIGSKTATVKVTTASDSVGVTASCTSSITETAAEAKKQCNGRFSTTTDETATTTDNNSDSETFGWFGGLVTEVGECEISPEVYVPFFAITKCGESVSQMSGSMDAYAINYIGSVSQGQTVLGNAIPGLVCLDRTDIPIGVVTNVEAGASGCGTEDSNILDQILNAVSDITDTGSLISW